MLASFQRDFGLVDIAIVDSFANNALHQLELVDVITGGQRVENHVGEVAECISVQECTGQLRVVDGDFVLVLTVTPVVHSLDIRVSRTQDVRHCRRVIGSGDSRVCDRILHVSAEGNVNTLEDAKRVLVDRATRLLKEDTVDEAVDELVHKGGVLHNSSTGALKGCVGGQRNVVFQSRRSLNNGIHDINSSSHK